MYIYVIVLDTVQYQRSICMGFTRQALVNPIQIGCEYRIT